MDVNFERIPPSSMDAELCVLGSMLRRAESLRQAVCDVRPDWFYRPANRIIFDCMAKMTATGQAVDAVTLRQALRDARRYDECGGDDYLLNIASGTPDASSVQHYAAIMRDKAAKRSLIIAADKMLAEGYDSSICAEDAVGNAYASLQNILAGREDGRGVDISDAVSQVLQHAEAVVMGEATLGLATGFGVLDREILSGGLRPAELVVIAADTSVGKTVVGMDFMRSFCSHGFASFVASAEMTASELGLRALSAESTVPINTIRAGRYTEREMNAIHAAKAKLAAWRMKVLEGSRTISDIAAHAKRANALWDGQLGAVVVDYLQLMIPEDAKASREQQVGMMALRCKQAATQMRIPWILMSQFNRSHQAQNHAPGMSNLRDSGQIEQHANIVILLHPTNKREMIGDTPEAGLGYYEIGVMVPKNRSGMTHAGWSHAIVRKVRRFCGRTDA